MAEEPYRGPDAPPPAPPPSRRRNRPAGAAADEFRAEIEDLRRRVQQNDDEIDAMQIAAAQGAVGGRVRWLREPAVLISVLSLLLALGTTALSSTRLDQERQHEARIELTGYIERLTDIPRLQAEITQQHPGASGSNLLAELNAQLQSLAFQARNVIRSIPDQVATVEYMAVGYSLQTTGALSDAEELYRQGLDRAASPADKIYSLRSLAAVRFLVRDYAGGRELYQQARDVYQDFPEAAALVVANDDAQTELMWATVELSASFCTEATAHAAAAQQIMAGEPLTNLTPLLEQLQSAIATCAPQASPAPT